MTDQFKEPEKVVEELMALDDLAQARMRRALSWFANKLGNELDNLYQESILRILDGRRRCPIKMDALTFFIGVARSIANELYEQEKKRTDQEDLIALDGTFWGNQEPPTPETMLMIIRGESENLPEDFLKCMLDEANANNDSEVVQYLIHSLTHGLKHREIVEMSNWSPQEAQAIQRRASRLTDKHVEQSKKTKTK